MRRRGREKQLMSVPQGHVTLLPVASLDGNKDVLLTAQGYAQWTSHISRCLQMAVTLIASYDGSHNHGCDGTRDESNYRIEKSRLDMVVRVSVRIVTKTTAEIHGTIMEGGILAVPPRSFLPGAYGLLAGGIAIRGGHRNTCCTRSAGWKKGERHRRKTVMPLRPPCQASAQLF